MKIPELPAISIKNWLNEKQNIISNWINRWVNELNGVYSSDSTPRQVGSVDLRDNNVFQNFLTSEIKDEDFLLKGDEDDERLLHPNPEESLFSLDESESGSYDSDESQVHDDRKKFNFTHFKEFMSKINKQFPDQKIDFKKFQPELKKPAPLNAMTIKMLKNSGLTDEKIENDPGSYDSAEVTRYKEFRRWIDKIEDTAMYKEDPEGTLGRVSNLLHEIEKDPEIGKKLMGILADGIGACDDRTALYLIRAERALLEYKLQQEVKGGNYNLNQVLEKGARLYQMQAIEEITEKIVQEQDKAYEAGVTTHLSDWVEIEMLLHQTLQAEFGLPVTIPAMKFGQYARITESDIDEARTHLTNIEGMKAYLGNTLLELLDSTKSEEMNEAIFSATVDSTGKLDEAQEALENYAMEELVPVNMIPLTNPYKKNRDDAAKEIKDITNQAKASYFGDFLASQGGSDDKLAPYLK